MNLPATLEDHLDSPPGMRMSCCGCLCQRLHSVPSIPMSDTRNGSSCASALYTMPSACSTCRTLCLLAASEMIKSKRVHFRHHSRLPCTNLVRLGTTSNRLIASSPIGVHNHAPTVNEPGIVRTDLFAWCDYDRHFRNSNMDPMVLTS